MSVTNPRSRLVNFRVSEDEFHNLRKACVNGGARSISAFARTAVLGSAGVGTEQEQLLRAQLSILEQKMGEVDAKLLMIASLLRERYQPIVIPSQSSINSAAAG